MFDMNKSMKKMLGPRINIPKYGRINKFDSDGDGIPNRRDCQPNNMFRQDTNRVGEWEWQGDIHAGRWMGYARDLKRKPGFVETYKAILIKGDPDDNKAETIWNIYHRIENYPKTVSSKLLYKNLKYEKAYDLLLKLIKNK